MDEMTGIEIVKNLAEDNRTRLIIDILEECETLEEALEKVKALLIK